MVLDAPYLQSPTVAHVTKRYETAKKDYEEFEKEIIQIKSTESSINTIVERKAYDNLITSYETTLKERRRVMNLLFQHKEEANDQFAIFRKVAFKQAFDQFLKFIGDRFDLRFEAKTSDCNFPYYWKAEDIQQIHWILEILLNTCIAIEYRRCTNDEDDIDILDLTTP